MNMQPFHIGSPRLQKQTGLLAFASVLLVGSFGCGSSSANCSTLLQQYATEFQNALICDPTVPNQCNVQRPTIVSQVNGQTQTLEGLSSNCTHVVNGSRTARLDDILSEYTAHDCKTAPTPLCLVPMNVCQLSPQGTGTCR
jgi:hypothetical protein